MVNEGGKQKLIIIAQAGIDKRGVSGSDMIFIELARNWSMRGIQTIIWTGLEGYEVCQGLGLANVGYDIIKPCSDHLPFALRYILRISRSIIKAIRMKLSDEDMIYSSSDFFADAIPAFIIKKRFRNIKWIAGFYLFAPRPWQKDSPYKGKRFFLGLLYWLTQKPVYWIVKRCADMVFVTSEPDVNKFITSKRNKEKIIVVRGGVDIKPSTECLNSNTLLPVENRKYDAVFMGRLHYQKGVLELIDIWSLVRKVKSDAMLVIIGNGPLENEIKEKIKRYDMDNNIELVGYKDADEKYDIFKKSKIVVHPAMYDSGGMAAAEAMAWGLPAVGFDLEALKTYYPKGMSKIPRLNYEEFAREIIHLLSDKDYYRVMSQEARSLIVEHWDWEKRASFIYSKIFEG